jgi:hypothetical protein
MVVILRSFKGKKLKREKALVVTHDPRANAGRLLPDLALRNVAYSRINLANAVKVADFNETIPPRGWRRKSEASGQRGSVPPNLSALVF